jgi:hypothetical protein
MSIWMKLLPAAILGTVVSYFIISTFIVQLTFLKYLGIEAIVSVFHALYNSLKKQLS